MGQRRLLTSLNPILLVGVVMGLIFIRTTAEPILPDSFRRWDLMLPVMIFIGQRRSLYEGLLLVLFLSHLFSLASSAPIGVFVIYYLLIFVIARLLSYVIYADQWLTILMLIFIFSIGARVILPLVAWFFNHGWPFFSLENLNPFGFMVNTLLGLMIYWVMGTMDKITFKAPPSNIEMGGT